jgi:hypothetical protein
MAKEEAKGMTRAEAYKKGIHKKHTKKAQAQILATVCRMIANLMHKYEIKEFLCRSNNGPKLSHQHAEWYIGRARKAIRNRLTRVERMGAKGSILFYSEMIRHPGTPGPLKFQARRAIDAIMGYDAPTKIAGLMGKGGTGQEPEFINDPRYTALLAQLAELHMELQDEARARAEAAKAPRITAVAVEAHGVEAPAAREQADGEEKTDGRNGQ